MSLALWLYVADVLDNISGVLMVITAVLAVFLGGALVIWWSQEENSSDLENKKCRSRIFKMLLLLIITTIFSIVTPLKATVYLMLGATYLQSSDIPAKVHQALELKLDEVIGELTHKNKKE